MRTNKLTGRRAIERFGDFGHVGDDCLDAIAFTLDLCHKAWHLIAVITKDIFKQTVLLSSNR